MKKEAKGKNGRKKSEYTNAACSTRLTIVSPSALSAPTAASAKPSCSICRMKSVSLRRIQWRSRMRTWKTVAANNGSSAALDTEIASTTTTNNNVNKQKQGSQPVGKIGKSSQET